MVLAEASIQSKGIALRGFSIGFHSCSCSDCCAAMVGPDPLCCCRGHRSVACARLAGRRRQGNAKNSKQVGPRPSITLPYFCALSLIQEGMERGQLSFHCKPSNFIITMHMAATKKAQRRENHVWATFTKAHAPEKPNSSSMGKRTESEQRLLLMGSSFLLKNFIKSRMSMVCKANGLLESGCKKMAHHRRTVHGVGYHFIQYLM